MTALSLAALVLSAAAAAPLYFRRLDSRRARLVLVPVILLLLGAAAVAGLASPDGAGAPAYAAAVLAAAVGGGPVTAAILRASFRRGHPGQGSDAVAADDGPDAAGQVLRGGTWIGLLERTAISATLLAGWPEGVAVVLAIKGLGRYPELRQEASEERAGAAERFIVGTLASVLWASAAAGVGLLNI